MIPIIFRPSLVLRDKDVERYSMAIRQVILTNPSTSLHIITEDPVVDAPAELTQHAYTDYIHERHAELEQNFENFNSNFGDDECNKLLSFLVLEKFMERNKFDNCFMLEPQILLLSNIEEVFEKTFPKCDIALCGKNNKTTCAFITLPLLQFYNKFVLKQYGTEKGKKTMEGIFTKMKNQGQLGGIEANTFFYWLNKKLYGDHSFIFEDLLTIHKESVFDEGVNTNQQQFKMNGNFKILYEINNKTYAEHIDGRKIEMHSLNVSSPYEIIESPLVDVDINNNAPGSPPILQGHSLC